MPGVLVEPSASSPLSFPLEPSSFSASSSLDSNNCNFNNNEFYEPSSPLPRAADRLPSTPQLPNSLPQFDALSSPPPSPSSYRARELAQRSLPKSNLGHFVNSNVADSSFDCSSELNGMPIPSPRKSLYCSTSTDSMVGSPLLSDSNGVGSPIFSDLISALHKFLPSNNKDDEVWPVDAVPAMDAYSCDEFRMYEFKVRRCMRGRSHDWTECPFAHPGEKARRRDPRRIHYSGTACPDFRKGSCKRGDACEYAHGVFECWLHPARYRTQPCKDGRACRRRVCFFAHTVEQLRVLPSASTASTSPVSVASSPRKTLPSYDGSPLRQALAGSLLSETTECNISNEDGPLSPWLLQKAMEGKGFRCGGYGLSLSPTSTLHDICGSSPPGISPLRSPSPSPPMSPEVYWPRNMPSTQFPLANSTSVPSHRRHLNRLQTMPTISVPLDTSDSPSDAATFEDVPVPFSLPASAPLQYPHNNVAGELLHSLQALQLRSRITELHQKSGSTPSSMKYSIVQKNPLGHGLYCSMPAMTTDAMLDLSELVPGLGVEPTFRVESGRDLRASIYGKIRKENGVESNEDPDLGWVNELVQ